MKNKLAYIIIFHLDKYQHKFHLKYCYRICQFKTGKNLKSVISVGLLVLILKSPSAWVNILSMLACKTSVVDKRFPFPGQRGTLAEHNNRPNRAVLTSPWTTLFHREDVVRQAAAVRTGDSGAG